MTIQATGYVASSSHRHLKPVTFERDGPGSAKVQAEVHDIAPDAQVIPIDRITDACRQVKGGDVRLRYVIDMAGLKDAARE